MRCRVRTLAPTVVLLASGLAGAAEFAILGAKLVVKDPSGSEDRRSVVATAKEQASDISALADPTAGGAVLTITLDGGTATTQSFVLDAGGWSASGTSGYRYAGPIGADGDCVKKVVLQRRASGTALLKLTLRGNVGTQALALLPPNPGAQASLALEVGSDRYCTVFGGAAGGTVRTDTSAVWKITAPESEGACPITTTTSSSSTTSTTTTAVCGDGVVQVPEQCEPVSAGACPPIPEVACGAPGGPVPCQCCVVPAAAVVFVISPPVCCDGSPCNFPNPFICECPP